MCGSCHLGFVAVTLQGVFMDPNILNSNAFSSNVEKLAVQDWRDGVAGEILQRRMAEVAAQRYFEFGFADSDRTLFVTGRQWVGFARFVGNIESVLENELGPSNSWPDLAKGFHQELWRGKHDLHLSALAWVLPSHKDDMITHARLKNEFPPLAATLLHLAAKDAMRISQPALIAAVAAGSSDIFGSQPRDVTDAVGSQTMSSSEKRALVQKLICRASSDRDARLTFELTRSADEIFRSNCKIVSSPDDAKLYMGACGLMARTVWVA